MSAREDVESQSWSCTICCNNYLGDATVIEGCEICSACVQQLFDNSITAEENFPPRWGSKILDPWDYRRILNTHFLRAFKQKEDEWTCPARERIYCRQKDPPRRPEECSNFLGRMADEEVCRRCNACMWYTCLRCLECFSVGDAAGKSAVIEHHCDPDIEKSLRERAFEGLKRGKDYQDCPNESCQRRIELKEGCNHITCLCGKEYCYICGRLVVRGQMHWTMGGCPQYGQPGTGREIFQDAMPAWEEDDLAWHWDMFQRQEQRDIPNPFEGVMNVIEERLRDLGRAERLRREFDEARREEQRHPPAPDVDRRPWNPRFPRHERRVNDDEETLADLLNRIHLPPPMQHRDARWRDHDDPAARRPAGVRRREPVHRPDVRLWLNALHRPDADFQPAPRGRRSSSFERWRDEDERSIEPPASRQRRRGRRGLREMISNARRNLRHNINEALHRH